MEGQSGLHYGWLSHSQDLIKLYAVYNDSLINLLGKTIIVTLVIRNSFHGNSLSEVILFNISMATTEKFFEMKKQQCRETMEVYRKFLTRQDGVQKFLQLAEVPTSSQTLMPPPLHEFVYYY